MNKNKNNSIIFLTTLSVYLGLVLVGGAPQVSAQSPTKGCYELQSHHPTGRETEFYIASEFIGKPVQILIARLNELSQQKKFSFQKDFNYKYLEVATAGEVLQVSIVSSDGNALLETELKKLVREFTGNFYGSPLPHFNEKSQKNSYYYEANFQLNAEELTVKVTTEQQKPEYAEKTAFSYDAFFQNALAQEQDKTCQLIYQNTKTSFENNQVFIVTRLPRGSLDALLKQDAKAEK